MKLEISQLNKAYGHNQALCDLCYVFTPGVYGLLGPNGAGKSTFINLLTHNLDPTSGNIRFNGVETADLKQNYLAKLGFVPQQQQMFPGFTLRRFLWYMAGLKGLKKSVSKEQIKHLVMELNLQDVMDRKLSAFSGGMKQRALLAQALLGDPAIIILDEPTAGLDPRERVRFRNLVAKVAFDRIVIIATHVVSDIQYIANKVLVMNKGRVVAEGEPGELCESIRGKVFELAVEEQEISSVEQSYKVVDMKKELGKVSVRVISETLPKEYSCQKTDPNLEDVYLYWV